MSARDIRHTVNATGVIAQSLRDQKGRDGKQGHASRVFTAILFGVFVLMLLLAFLAGVTVYKNLNASHSAIDNYRSSENLVVNSVLANNSADALSVAKGPEGAALVLTETDAEGSYETRIYLYQGNIVEEYAVAGSPYDPQQASVLASSKVFSFSLKGNLLRITTNHGTAEVALRCAEGVS